MSRRRATRAVYWLVILALVALAAAGCGGGGGGGGTSGGDNNNNNNGGNNPPPPSSDTTAPAVSSVQVNPGYLTYTGGTITITAAASDNVGVAVVRATITKPDNTTNTVTLIGSGTYVGQYTVPQNSTAAGQTYKITVTAQDTSGNTASYAQQSLLVFSQADSPPDIPM